MVNKTVSAVNNDFEKTLLINVLFKKSLASDASDQVINHQIVNDIISHMYRRVHKIIDKETAAYTKSHAFAFVPSLSGYYRLDEWPCAVITLGLPDGYDPHGFWIRVDSVLRQSDWVKRTVLAEISGGQYRQSNGEVT